LLAEKTGKKTQEAGLNNKNRRRENWRSWGRPENKKKSQLQVGFEKIGRKEMDVYVRIGFSGGLWVDDTRNGKRGGN